MHNVICWFFWGPIHCYASHEKLMYETSDRSLYKSRNMKTHLGPQKKLCDLPLKCVGIICHNCQLDAQIFFYSSIISRILVLVYSVVLSGRKTIKTFTNAGNILEQLGECYIISILGKFNLNIQIKGLKTSIQKK